MPAGQASIRKVKMTDNSFPDGLILPLFLNIRLMLVNNNDIKQMSVKSYHGNEHAMVVVAVAAELLHFNASQ